MFEQTFVMTGKTKKGWTVMVSLIVQCLLLVVAVILPMVYFDVLPAAQLSSFLVAPPPPPPPPPPPAAAPIVKIVKVIPRQFDAGKLIAPKSVPKEIAVISESELPPTAGGVVGGVPGGVGGGAVGGVLGGIIGSVPTAAPPPPPPPKAVVPQRIRVGGNVQAANLINQVRPIYPPLAKQARISGVVELSAIIGKDGRVQDLKVVRGHPLLVQAALDAVKNWVYRPTLLNGEPVEVSTTIDVNFTLSQ
ncbi:MAG: energy transducer TonB [Bryobacteraceae bacterium]